MKRTLIKIALVPLWIVIAWMALPLLALMALTKAGDSRAAKRIEEAFGSIPEKWKAAVLYSIVYGVLFLIGWLLGT